LLCKLLKKNFIFKEYILGGGDNWSVKEWSTQFFTCTIGIPAKVYVYDVDLEPNLKSPMEKQHHLSYRLHNDRQATLYDYFTPEVCAPNMFWLGIY
jgi:hypothetical protein